MNFIYLKSLFHPFWNLPNTGLDQFKYFIDAVLSQFVNKKRNRKCFYISFCLQNRKTLTSCVKNSVKRIKGKTSFQQDIQEVLSKSTKVLRLQWKTWWNMETDNENQRRFCILYTVYFTYTKKKKNKYNRNCINLSEALSKIRAKRRQYNEPNYSQDWS